MCAASVGFQGETQTKPRIKWSSRSNIGQHGVNVCPSISSAAALFLGTPSLFFAFESGWIYGLWNNEAVIFFGARESMMIGTRITSPTVSPPILPMS
ncbi:hypothetical protein J6590_001557 [Homalodisca vitripennis]|nr:hypothetical protein J6590_001557 [Homalodisca vitripennis]